MKECCDLQHLLEGEKCKPFLAEWYLATALFLDIIASFWRWHIWLCCRVIIKAITAWSCNNSKVKILERHEINCLRSSSFFKEENVSWEKSFSFIMLQVAKLAFDPNWRWSQIYPKRSEVKHACNIKEIHTGMKRVTLNTFNHSLRKQKQGKQKFKIKLIILQ